MLEAYAGAAGAAAGAAAAKTLANDLRTAPATGPRGRQPRSRRPCAPRVLSRAPRWQAFTSALSELRAAAHLALQRQPGRFSSSGTGLEAVLRKPDGGVRGIATGDAFRRLGMLIALRRRLRLPLPVAPHRCGAHGHGCGTDGCLRRPPRRVPSHWTARPTSEAPRARMGSSRARSRRTPGPNRPSAVVGPRGSPPPRLRCLRGPPTRRSVMLRRDTRFPVDTRRKAPALRCLARWSRNRNAIAVAERRKRAAYPELLRPGPLHPSLRGRRAMERRVPPLRHPIGEAQSSARSCRPCLVPPSRVGCAAGGVC